MAADRLQVADAPILPLVEALVEDRVTATLAKLVTSHRNGVITAQEALSGIATISGLRLLTSDLEAKLKR
jgi:hypothetical protein